MKYFIINYKENDEFKKLITKEENLDKAEVWFEKQFPNTILYGILERGDIMEELNNGTPALIGQITVGDRIRYFDKTGKELTDGCKVKYPDGTIKKVYLTEEGNMGTDATNPIRIEKGLSVPCEAGIYPFEYNETKDLEVVEE